MPSSTSCYHTRHNHTVGTDESPGLCLRQDPFHSSSQASAAGRSSSTQHCSPWGHLTLEIVSVSREVTEHTPLQLNLPPDATSPSTPLAGNSHHQHGHGSPTTQPPRRRACPGLMPAHCSSACRSTAETSTPLPSQAGRKLAKRSLEMATEEQVELGHPHRAAAFMCDSLILQHTVH